jgi:hypothetical protein
VKSGVLNGSCRVAKSSASPGVVEVDKAVIVGSKPARSISSASEYLKSDRSDRMMRRLSATKTPRPCLPMSSPSITRSLRARRTVIALTPNVLTSCASEGIFEPDL